MKYISYYIFYRIILVDFINILKNNIVIIIYSYIFGMPRHATKDANIYKRYSQLHIIGDYTTIPDEPTTGSLYVKGDTNIIGDCNVFGDIYANGVLISNQGSTSINLLVGAKDGYVLTTDEFGAGTWKTPHWFTNDLPTEITTPTDNNIWTEQNVGIGTTNPTEKLEINASSLGDGLLSGSAFVGAGLTNLTDLMIAQVDNKNSTDYALIQESGGDTILNSSTNVVFSISDTEAARFDGSGNLGIGIDTPTALLHVNGDAIVEGNLTVNGTLTTVNSSTVEIEDAALLLGRNNPADALDSGFIAQYVDSGVTKFAGMYRDASSTNKHFEIFQNLQDKPTTVVNTLGTGYERASLSLDGLDAQSGITFSQANAEINHNGFVISGTEPQVFFDTSGNIGIGVTVPTYDIDIAGDVNVNGVYRVNGTQVLNETTLSSSVVNSSLTSVGTLTSLNVSGDVDITSNLSVTGTATFEGDAVFNQNITFTNPISTDINDNLLVIAKGNDADTSDVGIYGHYIDGVTRYTGLIRDSADGNYTLFTGVTSQPSTTNVDISTGDYANLNVKSLLAHDNINVDSGFTYQINSTDVLSSSTLGSGVTSSNLQVVGDLQSLNIVGDLTVDTNTLYVDSADNRVGILTLTPNYPLDVAGSGAIGAASLEANVDADLVLKQAASRNLTIKDSTDSTLFTITSGGNVGIGVTNPTNALQVLGTALFENNVTIDGDLIVNGTQTFLDSNTLELGDSLIKMARNNIADTIDIGIYGLRVDGGVTKFDGIFRDASDGIFKIFTGLEVEPTTTVDTGATGYQLGTVQMAELQVDRIEYPNNDTNLTFTNSGTVRSLLTPAGFFGIGTTAEYPLHVNKVNPSNWSSRIVNSTTEVFLANSDGNGISINSGVANTNTNLNVNVRNATTNNVFVVRNDDKVGILTSAPDRTFHVNTSVAGEGLKSGNSFVGNLIGDGTVASFSHDSLSQTTNSYAIKQSSVGQTNINAASGQELRMNINNSQIITVTSAGNVGIGETAPTNKLEVVGNSTITAANGDALILSNTLTDINMANADGSGILVNATTTSNYGLSVGVSGTAIFQVNNNGTVGIGGVVVPNAELEVRDTIRVSNTNDDWIDINAGTDNLQINSNDLLSIGVSGTQTINVDTNNNVGIGTTVPDNELTVSGTINATTAVLVGVTTATEALYINGDGVITGDLTVGGNLIFDGIGVDGLTIQDSLIKFANNNQSDTVDIGFYGLYNDGVSKYTGLFRDATDGVYNLFHESIVDPTTIVDTGATGYSLADLNVSTLNADTEVIAPEFTATCDIRVKENIDIMKINECYDKIKKLGLFSYTYDKEFNKSDERLYGLIAQNVEAHIPEAIKEKKVKCGSKTIDDFKTISQNTIIANLIGAVQHLTQKVEMLEKQLKK